MKNILKLVGIALLGTALILGVNEFILNRGDGAPVGDITVTDAAAAKPAANPATPSAEELERILEMRRNMKEQPTNAPVSLFGGKPSGGIPPLLPGVQTPKEKKPQGGNGAKPSGGGGSGGGSGGGKKGGGGGGGGGGSGGGAGGGGTSEDPASEEPSSEEGATATNEYWLDSEGIRHNSKCVYYKNVLGSACGPSEGTAHTSGDSPCGG